MIPRLVLGTAFLVALPALATAQTAVRQCIVTPDGVREVEAVLDRATGDVTVTRGGQRVAFDVAYPQGPQHAATAAWYRDNAPIEVGGARYVKYGLPRVLGVNEVARIAAYRGVPVFAEAPAREATPEVVYVAVRQGCEFQPYQRDASPPPPLPTPRPSPPPPPVRTAPTAPRPDGLPLTVGQTRTGMLAPGDPLAADSSYYDLYRFTAVAGQRYTITLASSAFDAYLSVGTQNGADFESLGTNDDGPEMGTNAQLVFVAPRSGRFAVRANSLQAGETGAYTLRLERR